MAFKPFAGQAGAQPVALILLTPLSARLVDER